MFRGDDDDDFTPGSSSKLASLFGAGKSSQEDNTSLTYTAPKQPKKGHVEGQSVKGQAVGQAGGQTVSSASKLSIIAVKAVHTYKLANGNYNAQGKLGAAVLGNAVSRVYQLLLYKGKQQHVTSACISPSFQFVVQANNYATFYDDQMQNWSVMFESSGDAIEFAKEVGLARSNTVGEQGDHNLMTQDLLFGVGSVAAEGDIVDVRYIVFPLTAGKLGEEVENTTDSEKPRRVKLKKGSWEEGLVGVAKGCKRMIILPPVLVGPWKGRVPADSGVVLEVDVGRIKSGNRSSHTDSGESALDSSTDDTSIRARGASISEALTNSPKTHKASIISRMARMGQATLPLKGAIVCDPSDSEEAEEELSGPGDTAPSMVSKAPIKMRQSKSRTVSSSSVPSVPMSTGTLPQQLTIYQPVPPQAHQYMRTDGSLSYMQPQGQLYPLVAQQAVNTQQIFPLPPTAISTPPAISSPDSHLSVFLAETRTQNSEVRMGVAKVADKVDQVLMKLNDLQHHQSLPTMEPSTLLMSIQKLVSDNEQLRAELQDKREKIDLQNEKMYQLLHSNQKYLEQCHDAPLKTLILTLQQEKAKLGADLSEALSRVSTLELQVASAGKTGQGLGEEVLAMSSQLKMQQSELESSRQVLQEQQQQLQAYSKSVEDLQAIRDQLENKLQEDACGYQQRMSELIKSHQAELAELRKDLRTQQQQNTVLRDRLRALQTQLQEGFPAASAPSVVDEVKKVMNVVYHTLQPHFVPEVSYDGLKIRHTLMSIIRDVTLKYIEVNSSRSQHTNDAANGIRAPAVMPQVPNVETESVVTSEVGSRATQSFVHERVVSRTEDGGSAEKPAAQENSDSLSKPLQNSGLEAAASDSREPMRTAAAQEKNQLEEEGGEGSHVGRVVDRQTHLDPPVQVDNAGEHACYTGLVSVTEMGDITGQMGESKEKDGHLREPSLERSWRPQPPPPPLFDDDDEDDDWLS